LAWNWGCVSVEGMVGEKREREGIGILDTCICTHINLLLLSLCQWATFEVRCRQGNKTNTNDKAQAMTTCGETERVEKETERES